MSLTSKFALQYSVHYYRKVQRCANIKLVILLKRLR